MKAASWMLNELLKGGMIKVSPGLLAGGPAPCCAQAQPARGGLSHTEEA